MRSIGDHALRAKPSTVLLCAAATLTLATGCVESKPRRGITYADPGSFANANARNSNGGKPDLSSLTTYLPQGLSSSSSAVSAAIGPIGSIEYDRNLLPLISPAGEYLAVQGRHPGSVEETWQTILADPAGDAPSPFDIIIYRIEKVDGGPGQRVVEHRRLDGIGLIGRSADQDTFLVESPQPDGSRRIGRVQWKTGEVNWLVKTGINAFAAQSASGRLAWCERVDGDKPHFNLYVQGRNEVYIAGDDDGSWLFPVWCQNEQMLFAFHLLPTGALDLVLFDTQSAQAMRYPLQTERLTEAGTIGMVSQALAGIPDPAAPDGSPRMLFYHTEQGRIFEYDARFPEGRRVRGFPAPSVAAAWHNGEGVIYSSLSKLYYQFLREGSEPVELLTGARMPRKTSNPMHPFVLMAVDEIMPYQLNLFAMDLVDEDAVRAAAAQLDPSKVNNPRR